MLTLRSVLRRWRGITDASSLAWRHVALDDEKGSPLAQRRQAEIWAKLSYPLAFVVEVNAVNADNMLPLVSTDRWRSFSCRGQRDVELSMEEMSLNSFAFHKLNVSICDWEHESSEEDNIKTLFVPTYSAWPFGYTMNI